MTINIIFKTLYNKLAWIPFVTIANIAIIVSTIYTLTHPDHTQEIAAILANMAKNTAILTNDAVPSDMLNDPVFLKLDNLQDDIIIIRSRISAIDLNPEGNSNTANGVDIYAVEIFKIVSLLVDVENFTRNFGELYTNENMLFSRYLLTDADFYVLHNILSNSNLKEYRTNANANWPDKKKRKVFNTLLNESWLREFLENTEVLTQRAFKTLNLQKKEYILNKGNSSIRPAAATY